MPTNRLSIGVIAASVACWFGAIAPALAGQACHYSDLMPKYRAFEAQTAGQTAEQRARVFVAQFASKHPEYYTPKIYGSTDELTKRAAEFFDPAKRTFANLPPLTDEKMAAVERNVGAQFGAAQKKFLRTFPDFRCNTFVAIAPSLMVFDGHPQDFGGRSNLLFGVDMIALVHGPQDMPSFFAHEIFHLYHAQMVGKAAPSGAQPGWWTMWIEGLATYASQRMNPGLSAQQVLWIPNDIVTRMEKDRARAATLMLADIEKTNIDANRWFYVGTSVEGLPARAGYWFGYEFAKSIGRGTTLRDLARMKPKNIRVAEIAFLRKQAGL